MSLKKRQRKYSPRGKNTYRALRLIGLLGFATVRQLCLTIWENERSTTDTLNRLLENNFLHQAHEEVDLASGRGNRIVFLARTGVTWLLKKGQLREEDIAYYWRGGDHWHPGYNDHDVAVHNVLCAFIRQARDHPENAIDIRLDPHVPLGEPDESLQRSSPLQDHTLIPDRIFAIKYFDQIVEAYLEVDMGTEPKTQWQEKLQKYLMSPEVMDRPGQIILCVAHTKRRMKTLLRWSEELANERFLFSHLDNICYSYSRQGKDLVLTNQGNPFGKVWHTIIGNKKRSLFRGTSP